MNAPQQFALGLQLKLDGQHAALAHAGPSWVADALAALRRFVVGREQPFAIEDFRQWALVAGELTEPAHHNAWGALPRAAISDGLIEWTGQYRPALSAKTHAHPVRLYRGAAA